MWQHLKELAKSFKNLIQRAGRAFSFSSSRLKDDSEASPVQGEEPAAGSKTRIKKPRTLLWRGVVFTMLAAAAVCLFLLGRTLYVVFQNPMSAFPAKHTPVATIQAPTPLETPIPTPVKTPVVTASPALPTEEPQITPIISPTPTITEEPLRENPGLMENRVNILLLGYDKSPEREDEENELYRDETNDFRSDVLMLLTVDFEHKNAYLISIPRDSYAPIYNEKGTLYSKRGRWKINAAFAKGGSESKRGFSFAMQTVSKLLGVPIDYYAGVDMEGLKGVVNAMGGVEYDVDVEIRLNGRRLQKGYQKLNGQQVLDYCRARKGISTDVGRNDRQQRMLFTIFEQLKSRDQLVNFPKIYKSMKKYIRTNLTLEQIAAVAAFGVQLNMDDIKRYTLEGEYNSKTPYSSANYYLIDHKKLSFKMNEIFGVKLSTNPRYDLYYVLADIAGEKAKKEFKLVEPLISHRLVRSGVELGNVKERTITALREQALALQAVSVRGKDADLDISLDEQAILKAQEALCQHMLALCTEATITQRDISASALPKQVYEMLPTQRAADTPKEGSQDKSAQLLSYWIFYSDSIKGSPLSRSSSSSLQITTTRESERPSSP